MKGGDNLDKVMLFNKTIPEIGLVTRKATEGVEFDLVQRFIDFTIDKFSEKNGSTKLAIFCEPMVGMGYPDVVLATYSPKVFEGWKEVRFSLTPSDLKVLQHIVSSGGIDSANIVKQLGVDSKDLLITLEKLLDARMIKRESKMWRSYSISKIYGIKKLIAVEAKINNWSAVLKQATLNKWFSSETYALSTLSTKPTKRIINLFENNGVGIYVFNGDFKRIKESPVLKLPSCYGSFMFNEWIGRRHYLN